MQRERAGLQGKGHSDSWKLRSRDGHSDSCDFDEHRPAWLAWARDESTDEERAVTMKNLGKNSQTYFFAFAPDAEPVGNCGPWAEYAPAILQGL